MDEFWQVALLSLGADRRVRLGRDPLPGGAGHRAPGEAGRLL